MDMPALGMVATQYHPDGMVVCGIAGRFFTPMASHHCPKRRAVAGDDGNCHLALCGNTGESGLDGMGGGGPFRGIFDLAFSQYTRPWLPRTTADGVVVVGNSGGDGADFL